jgi:murein DD-endopeptidase MepM/ murein hydrolase activator NlpD
VEHDITVTRGADGAFVASDVAKKLVAHIHRAGATIDSSLYLSAMKAGIPADVVVEMIHMFSYEVDFQRDIRPGDSFEVFYNYYYTPEGQPAREGNISYASMHLGGRTVTLYRYQPDPSEPADYFDAHGQSAKSMLMKTPVDGARISSGFGMRYHPVLGYTRMHKGIDFAVPVGTPVMAAGSGVVQIAGRLGGYGNYLRINHGNGYSTAYGHLSRLAPGIHKGSRVHQGQIVAYSGNTGLTTGPHLHYEILVNGDQVNPARVKVATGRRLTGRQLRDFLGERIHIDAQLASMPLETKVADISTDLRQAKAK